MTDTKTIRDSFEAFNTYAASAQDPQNEDADIDAQLAVAFEISQLRFQLRRMFATTPKVGGTYNGRT